MESKKKSPKRKSESSMVKNGTGKSHKHAEEEKHEAGAPKEEKEKHVSVDIQRHLIKTKCEHFSKTKKLCTITFSSKIQDVWEMMIAKNILSAPVVSVDGHFEGFLDLVVIAEYIVVHFGDAKLKGKSIKKMTDTLSEELVRWTGRTVRDVFDFSKAHGKSPKLSDVQCIAGYSVFSAFEILAREGLHRVAVLESRKSSRLLDVVTQSQAVEYIYENLQHFGSKKSIRISEMTGVVLELVYSCTEQVTALSAFEYMLAKGVSALPVVDDNGAFKNAFALSDLHALGPKCELLPMLYLPVTNCLNVVTNVEDAAAMLGGQDRPKAKRNHTELTCTAKETLGAAVKKMHEQRVYRLFVLEDTHIIGVISLKEIIGALLD